MPSHVDLSAIKRELRLLPGVVAARVEGPPDRIESIELVTLPETPASEVVETARRQLAEKFAVTLDVDAISVSALPAIAAPAQGSVGAATTATGNGKARVRIDDVVVFAREATTSARVSLSWAGQQWDGVREGPNTSRRRWRLISEATLAGLEGILAEPGLFSLEDLRVVDMLDEQVAVVAVELTARRRGQRLTGSCSAAAAHGSIDEAVVRATLQAVNRLFGTFVAEGQQYPA